MPEMLFSTTEVAAVVHKELGEVRTLAAGQQVKLELGEDDADTVVPEGKVWNVNATIHIDETDA